MNSQKIHKGILGFALISNLQNYTLTLLLLVVNLANTK